MKIRKHTILRIMLGVMWIAVGTGVAVLLAAASHNRTKKLCHGLDINISGVSNNFFIDKEDVTNIITSYAGNNIKQLEIDGFNLRAMEAELKREVWIKNADLFFDNNNVLQASVEEREPIARIFSINENSFYIDNSNMMLPLSNKISARLPVFTGFPTDAKVLSKKDSALLNDIKQLSLQIQKDSFLMALIDQIDILPGYNFEMIPKIGDQIIVFGDAKDSEKKFEKLKLFYKKIFTKYGWSRYSIINLQYKGQVVAKLKGKDDISADSMRTVEIMHEMAINAARAASDSLQTFLQDNEKNSTDISLIQQSMERDDNADEEPVFPKYPIEDEPKNVAKPTVTVKPVTVEHKPAIKTPIKTSIKASIKATVKTTEKKIKPKVIIQQKTSVQKPSAQKKMESPKVVMPKKNDY